MSSSQDDRSHLSAPSPNPSNNGSNETFIDPSPIAPSSNGTEFTDLDEAIEPQTGRVIAPTSAVESQNRSVQLPELTVSTVVAIKSLAPLTGPLRKGQDVNPCQTYPISIQI